MFLQWREKLMKNLNVFDAINNLVGNSVRIYTGPIHKIYADEFELVRGRPLCKKKDVIVKRHASFFVCDDGKNFENLDYGIILPTHEEAIRLCDDAIIKSKTTLTNVLAGRITDPKEAHRILESVKESSTSLYYIPSELEFSHNISKKDFKQLVKKRETYGNQNKK
jgi:hypothetical protein